MSFDIRRARAEDHAAISAFTASTFEWGDYVADVLPDWLDDPNGLVLVAVDDSDTPVAVGRGVLLSDRELWLQGARVSEAWRRKGIGSSVTEDLIGWARKKGARVARLGTEEWNEPAQGQVEAAAFRKVGRWIVARRTGTRTKPITATNGGRRAQARRKLEQAPSSEAVPAWLSWRSGPLVQPARGLHVERWRWSQLELTHLEQAGKRGELWSSQAGWAWIRQYDERVEVGWLDCGPDDAADMVKSLIDLAAEHKAERLQITFPAVDWLEEPARARGVDPMAMLIYERSL